MGNRKAFANRKEFRKWLEFNHAETEPIWIEYYKDGRESIAYKETLEEALCFGWIDSTIKKIDEKIYVRKFLKRHKRSKWSEINKRLVQELTKKGLITQYGLQAIEEARMNGEWDRGDEREELYNVEGLRNLLINKVKDINDFDNLSESLKKHYALVYFSAKQDATRQKRLDLIIEYMNTKRRFI